MKMAKRYNKKVTGAISFFFSSSIYYFFSNKYPKNNDLAFHFLTLADHTWSSPELK